MLSNECEYEKCGESYIAERSTSRFYKPACRTAQHKLNKRRRKTLADLLASFPNEGENLDMLAEYNPKNKFLDMVAQYKNKKAVPDTLEIIWAVRQIGRLKAELKEKQEQISTSIELRKTIRSMCQASLADDGVQPWQM